MAGVQAEQARLALAIAEAEADTSGELREKQEVRGVVGGPVLLAVILLLLAGATIGSPSTIAPSSCGLPLDTQALSASKRVAEAEVAAADLLLRAAQLQAESADAARLQWAAQAGEVCGAAVGRNEIDRAREREGREGSEGSAGCWRSGRSP